MAYSRFTPGACCGCQSVEMTTNCGTLCTSAPRFYAVSFPEFAALPGRNCNACADVLGGSTVILDAELQIGGGGTQACRWQTDNLTVTAQCPSGGGPIRLQMFVFCDPSTNTISFELLVFIGSTSRARYVWDSEIACVDKLACMDVANKTMTRTSAVNALSVCDWPAEITLVGAV
jgi:hypothetical protein